MEDMNESDQALHKEPTFTPSIGTFAVDKKKKAFVLCLIYYSLDFDTSRTKAKYIDQESTIAAAKEILEAVDDTLIDIQTDDILKYYTAAKEKASTILNYFTVDRDGTPTKWSYVHVARFLFDQVELESTVQSIVSFKLEPAVVIITHIAAALIAPADG